MCVSIRVPVHVPHPSLGLSSKIAKVLHIYSLGQHHERRVQ